MHISDGVLSPAVLAGGTALAVAGTWIGLRRLPDERIMTAAVLSAAFFVVSLIHVPLGPSSVHLLLNGLAGIILGWAAFPCILVALFLQSILFQFGGLTALGVNALNTAAPGVLCHYLFRSHLTGRGPVSAAAAFLGGALAVAGTAIMAAFCLALTDAAFLGAARFVVATHAPVMLVEGLVAMFAAGFLARIRPELLETPSARESEREGEAPCG